MVSHARRSLFAFAVLIGLAPPACGTIRTARRRSAPGENDALVGVQGAPTIKR